MELVSDGTIASRYIRLETPQGVVYMTAVIMQWYPHSENIRYTFRSSRSGVKFYLTGVTPQGAGRCPGSGWSMQVSPPSLFSDYASIGPSGYVVSPVTAVCLKQRSSLVYVDVEEPYLVEIETREPAGTVRETLRVPGFAYATMQSDFFMQVNPCLEALHLPRYMDTYREQYGDAQWIDREYAGSLDPDEHARLAAQFSEVFGRLTDGRITAYPTTYGELIPIMQQFDHREQDLDTGRILRSGLYDLFPLCDGLPDQARIRVHKHLQWMNITGQYIEYTARYRMVNDCSCLMAVPENRLPDSVPPQLDKYGITPEQLRRAITGTREYIETLEARELRYPRLRMNGTEIIKICINRLSRNNNGRTGTEEGDISYDVCK